MKREKKKRWGEGDGKISTFRSGCDEDTYLISRIGIADGAIIGLLAETQKRQFIHLLFSCVRFRFRSPSLFLPAYCTSPAPSSGT